MVTFDQEEEQFINLDYQIYCYGNIYEKVKFQYLNSN